MCLRVRYSCCGCSLEAGSIAVAVLDIIKGVSGIISCITAKLYPIIVLPILSIIFGALLWYGVLAQKHLFVLSNVVWTALNIIGTGVSTLVMLGFAIDLSINGGGVRVAGFRVEAGMLWATTVLSLAFFALDLHLWSVVYSCMLKFKEAEAQRANGDPQMVNNGSPQLVNAGAPQMVPGGAPQMVNNGQDMPPAIGASKENLV